MPKRRLTAKRKAAIAKWQLAGALANRSHTNPIPHGKSWPGAKQGSFGTVRRHKLGGKAYQKKSGSTAKVSSEAQAILAGKSTFRDQTASDLGHPSPAKVPKPQKSWYAKPKAVHGSGTGLSSAYRYAVKPKKVGR